jgi:hypothetical protein
MEGNSFARDIGAINDRLPVCYLLNLQDIFAINYLEGII